MLIDHKKEIGYRTVERIIVFGKKDAGDYKYEQARSFVIILSACPQRPTETALSASTVLEWVQRETKNLVDILHPE